MGDVALVMASLKQVILINPNVHIHVVSREKFRTFFNNQPQITFIPADLDRKHKGIKGLFSLAKELKLINATHLLDLHQNLRTSILKTFLLFSIKNIFTVSKGRTEKSKLTKNKEFKPLKHTCERYLDVFVKAGIIENNEITKEILPVFRISDDCKNKIENWISVKNITRKIIGIAPFAQHHGKMWPLEKYKAVSEELSDSYQLIFFGGGNKEKELINENFADLGENIIGEMTLEEELYLMSKLEYMICGDTSNMHFAALMGTKVISIWGATHINAGFGPLFQPNDFIVEVPKEELPCRPCSVYGNIACYRKDYACLNLLNPESVLKKVNV